MRNVGTRTMVAARKPAQATDSRSRLKLFPNKIRNQTKSLLPQHRSQASIKKKPQEHQPLTAIGFTEMANATAHIPKPRFKNTFPQAMQAKTTTCRQLVPENGRRLEKFCLNRAHPGRQEIQGIPQEPPKLHEKSFEKPDQTTTWSGPS